MSKLKNVLEYLEKSIDSEHIEWVTENTKNALLFSDNAEAVVSIHGKGHPDFPAVNVKDTHESMELMMYNELLPACESVLFKDHRLITIRPNYGVGTLPSFFGAKSIFVNEKQMPWCEHLPSKEHIKRIISNGVPDLHSGYGQKIFETYEYYAEQLSHYPTVEKAAKFYHPDFQGPLDVAHLLYGTDIYYDMIDEPETVHGLLSVVTDTYIALMKEIKKHINDEEDGFCYHWNTLYRGNIVLRNDTAVNLSQDMYNEFVRPYDQKIINEFGEGSMHYCGQRQAWLKDMLTKTKGLSGINFGRVPGVEYDTAFLSEVYELARPNNISIICYNTDKNELLKIAKTDYRKGSSFITAAGNPEEAAEILAAVR